MRIALIGCKGIGFNGGVENVIREISTRLVNRGNVVTVYGRKKYSRLTGKINGVNNVNTFSIESKRLGQITSTFTSLIKASISGNFDIIHVHSFVNVSLLWIPKLFKKKTILTIHGLEWRINKWSELDKKILKFLLIFARIFPDEITSVSLHDANLLSKILKRKVEYIPNGVNLPVNKESNISKYFDLENNQYLLWVGRFSYQKGIEYLIDAFKEVTTTKKLVLVGYQYNADEFYKEILNKSKGDERIVFLGSRNGDELNVLYSNAYIVIHPSETESNSLVTLEALAFGNCLLASDIPGIRNVAKEKAYYFKSKDVKSLREKLQLLINNPHMVEEKQCGAKQHIIENFLWEDIITQYEKIYYNKLKEGKNAYSVSRS